MQVGDDDTVFHDSNHKVTYAEVQSSILDHGTESIPNISQMLDNEWVTVDLVVVKSFSFDGEVEFTGSTEIGE